MNDHNMMLAKDLAGTPLTGEEIRKRAQSFVGDADTWLEKLVQERMAGTGENYYLAYDAVIRTGLGADILKSREGAARLFEAQPNIN